MPAAYLRAPEVGLNGQNVNSMCRKVAFDSREMAMSVARMAQRGYTPGYNPTVIGRSAKGMKAYVCPMCPNPTWHVGHPPKS